MASSSTCETTGFKIQTRDMCNSLTGPHKGDWKKIETFSLLQLFQRGSMAKTLVVSVLDSQSSGPCFEFCSGHLLEFLLVVPGLIKSAAMLVNSQLAASGQFNPVMFCLIICFQIIWLEWP